MDIRKTTQEWLGGGLPPALRHTPARLLHAARFEVPK